MAMFSEAFQQSPLANSEMPDKRALMERPHQTPFTSDRIHMRQCQNRRKKPMSESSEKHSTSAKIQQLSAKI
jgi:hypothetical protein